MTFGNVVGLCVRVCVRVCVRERECVCVCQRSQASLYWNLPLCLKELSYDTGLSKLSEYTTCSMQKNSWISYNKHLFVSILCVVRPIQSVLSYVPLSHPMVQLSVTNQAVSHLLPVCACFCPIDTIQCDALFQAIVLTLRVGHVQILNFTPQAPKQLWPR